MTEIRRNHVLVFNPGSASLKFQIIAAGPAKPDLIRGEKLVSGVVEPIGRNAKLSLHASPHLAREEALSVEKHEDAAKAVMERIDSGIAAPQGIRNTRDIHVVGHRVVHGGVRYTEPSLIDDRLIASLQELEELAPLHNKSAVSIIRATRDAFVAGTPQVAVFDTAFHRTIPDVARIYPIPWDLTQRHKIQRYGFHGISHRYLMLRYAELTGTPLERTNIITLHLEGGSSATAISAGRSVDTSMGLTPLEGLMMSTRSGDIDPALIGFLATKENVGAAEVENWLNKKSGLWGVSGRSPDTRDLVQCQENDPRCRLALEMFAYRVRKYIGAYLAAMGEASAIVFGGGIGENTPEVRKLICEGLEWFGLDFDAARNLATVDCEGRITREGSRLHAFVIPTEESLMIAHEALIRCGSPALP